VNATILWRKVERWGARRGAIPAAVTVVLQESEWAAANGVELTSGQWSKRRMARCAGRTPWPKRACGGRETRGIFRF